MKKGSGPFFRKRCQESLFVMFFALGGAYARNCPTIDCQHLCVTQQAPRIGAEAERGCTAVKTSCGCYRHVDGGIIVGRVCVE